MLFEGDWAAGKEREEARPGDDDDEDEGSDIMGDFEDVETGQKFGADGDAATAAAMKAIDAAAAEEAAEQQRAADKAAKKAAFDADFDTGMMLRNSKPLVGCLAMRVSIRLSGAIDLSFLATGASLSHLEDWNSVILLVQMLRLLLRLHS